MRRILVPTDFSVPSLKAVRYAIELTDLLQGEMLLLHVVEGDPVRGYAKGRLPEVPRCWIDPMGDIFRWRCPQQLIHRDLCEEAQWKLSALLPPGFPQRFRGLVVVGKVVDEILWVAREQKANYLIIGAQWRRGIRHLFLRSIVDQVIRKASMAVITVWSSGCVISSKLELLGQAVREASSEQRTERRELGQRSRAQRRSPTVRSAP
jgi:nucleotide-binding universal stress UspA family protein